MLQLINMRVALAVFLAAALLFGASQPSSSAPANDLPAPETNFAGPILPPRPCVYEGNDPYEKRIYRLGGWKKPSYERYPGACERLRFAFGPILIKPGQNDILVEPVVIEKPNRDGYMTRFKPDLVLADGTVPPVERVHLHHATWISIPEYGGTIQFMASGEEKTIGTSPRGYGMPVKATDVWVLQHMVHSAVTEPMQAYITYDIDFIPEAKAKQLGIRPAYPVWLDVRPSVYPVFNVQRRFGGRDRKCTWPKEKCARFDPWGKRIVGQGSRGNRVGTDFRFPSRGEPFGRIRSFTGGTLVGIAGHLHPGGLYDTIELVRGGRAVKIFDSEARYWNRRNPRRDSGPPTSWDLSMTAIGLPVWGVRVRPGDVLRINATYDTAYQATYENMGIALAGLAPNLADGTPTAPGLNPFRARHDASRGCWKRTRGLRARRPVLCERGIVTHGHQAANGNYGGPGGRWRARPGESTTQVDIANFQYLPGDLYRAQSDGVPTVPLGATLRFSNLDGSAIYHTITTCRFPCLGRTGAAFPIGDGQSNLGRRVDFDSGQLGFGAGSIGSPAKQTLNWNIPITRSAGFRPGETITYFCRIHPFMRGTFQVKK